MTIPWNEADDVSNDDITKQAWHFQSFRLIMFNNGISFEEKVYN